MSGVLHAALHLSSTVDAEIIEVPEWRVVPPTEPGVAADADSAAATDTATAAVTAVAATATTDSLAEGSGPVATEARAVLVHPAADRAAPATPSATELADTHADPADPASMPPAAIARKAPA